jgi:S-phase kinase-associated protein 1
MSTSPKVKTEEIKTEEIKTEEYKTEIASLDDADNDMKEIILISKGGDRFVIPKKYAKISGLLKVSVEGDKEETEFPLDVDTEELALVHEYMEHHKGVEPPIVERPLKAKIMSENVKDPWDATFIDRLGKDPECADDVIRLCTASNYLEILSLLHLSCAKVASLIKGEPLEKMKKLLEMEEEEEAKKAEADKTVKVEPEQKE